MTCPSTKLNPANLGWRCCYYGYETEKRVVTLKNSGLKIECVDNGWQISEVPLNATFKTAFNQVCKKLNIKDDLLYLAPQTNGIDTEDRITMCALFLQDCIRSGL